MPSENELPVTWLMGLLTKAPTFRIKMVSKRSCGEPHFPSLLFDTVSVSSLGKESKQVTHSSNNTDKSYAVKDSSIFLDLLLVLERRRTEISVLVSHHPLQS